MTAHFEPQDPPPDVWSGLAWAVILGGTAAFWLAVLT